jgi:hypothetical protein
MTWGVRARRPAAAAGLAFLLTGTGMLQLRGSTRRAARRRPGSASTTARRVGFRPLGAPADAPGARDPPPLLHGLL